MRYAIAGCLLMALAACGARVEPEPEPREGIGAFLSRAFAAAAEGRDRLTSVPGGGLCGDPLLVGEVVGEVEGRGACGIGQAVRVSSVAGVRLSQQALVECRTAEALREWVVESAKPVLAETGGGLVELRVAAHYACRTRNHQPGAKLSEHGKGRAIDISAFRFADGSEITVGEGWRGRGSRRLRALHSAACGPFGTVLGPNSDRFHQNHFHFDVAQHRGGSYCR